MRKCSPPRRPSPWPLSLPTSWVKTCVNPKGILQQSPGLRGTSYPATLGPRGVLGTYPNGVATIGGERGCNPVGPCAPIAPACLVLRRGRHLAVDCQICAKRFEL